MQEITWTYITIKKNALFIIVKQAHFPFFAIDIVLAKKKNYNKLSFRRGGNQSVELFFYPKHANLYDLIRSADSNSMNDEPSIPLLGLFRLMGQ